MLTLLSKFIIWVLGWRVVNTQSLEEKYVLAGAPHTSNWDFPLAIMAILSLGIRFQWVGKHTLFKWPFGLFFRMIGGIPVNRRVRNRLIREMSDLFQIRKKMVLCIAPEGSRAVTKYWKTGFYYIALNAKVPIVLGYIDYKSKTMGIGNSLLPTGDLESDIQKIKEFYKDKTGKYQAKQGEVRVRTKEIEISKKRFGSPSRKL